jgi:hypothetical protein
VFKSFFLAGFECATGYNRHGEWIDQIAATQHDQFAREDYALLRRFGFRAARDGVRWPLVDSKGRYNFSTVRSRLEAAREHDVEVIWDLFHYGYPDDVDLFSDGFPRRFADYCYAAARYISARTDGVCYFTPINEPSFFAWAGGEAALFAPHQSGKGWDLKVALATAAIHGIDAIRAACPGTRIVNVDPICRVVAPPDRPDLEGEVYRFNTELVYQCWDIIGGRILPELGGSREHLDIIGLNYYWTNQWDITRVGTPLACDDPRCVPLRDLVREAWRRYGGDLLITETAHRDETRPAWVRELAGECLALLDEGVGLRGACLYPILGMPEWHAQHEWTRMGLWDLVPQSPTLGRILCEPMWEALQEAHRLDARLRAAEDQMELAAAA